MPTPTSSGRSPGGGARSERPGTETDRGPTRARPRPESPVCPRAGQGPPRPRAPALSTVAEDPHDDRTGVKLPGRPGEEEGARATQRDLLDRVMTGRVLAQRRHVADRHDLNLQGRPAAALGLCGRDLAGPVDE